MSVTTIVPHPLATPPLRNAGRRGQETSEIRDGQVTGRNLAHAHRTSSERAALAARLVLEQVQFVRPTIKQAAALVGVSATYIQAALELSEETRVRVAAGEVCLADALKANGLAAAYLAASPDVKAAFGRTVGPDEIWDSAIEPTID